MSAKNYFDFISLNKELLNCYSHTTASEFTAMEPSTQRGLCYQHRQMLEDKLIRRDVKLADFFAAAQA